MDNLERLDRYDFDQCSTLIDLIGIEELMDVKLLSVEHELELDSSRIERIRLVEELVLNWGRELGFDLSNRLPDDSCYHFFDEEGYQKVREEDDLGKGNLGLHKKDNIYILENDLETMTIGATLNRVIKAVGNNRISVTRRHKRFIVNELEKGYAMVEDDTYHWFNEGIIELTNISLMHTNHPDYTPLNASLALFVDRMVDYIARVENLIGVENNYEGILADFQKGYLTGNKKALGYIDHHFGTLGQERIARLPFCKSTMEYIDKARMILAFGRDDLPDSNKLSSYKVVSVGK
jgi:hypothetical protein